MPRGGVQRLERDHTTELLAKEVSSPANEDGTPGPVSDSSEGPTVDTAITNLIHVEISKLTASLTRDLTSMVQSYAQPGKHHDAHL